MGKISLRIDDVYESFVREKASELGLSLTDLFREIISDWAEREYDIHFEVNDELQTEASGSLSGQTELDPGVVASVKNLRSPERLTCRLSIEMLAMLNELCRQMPIPEGYTSLKEFRLAARREGQNALDNFDAITNNN